MASIFNIKGRLGDYVLDLLTTEDLPRVDVQEAPVIEYGEMSIERESMPILKSTMDVLFFDPEGRLSKVAEQGAIRAVLRGPGVYWQGNITNRMTMRPLNFRTRPGETRLKFEDGFGRLSTGELTSVLRGDRSTFGLGSQPSYANALAVIGSEIFERAGLASLPAVLTNVKLIDYAGTSHGQDALDSVYAGDGYAGSTLAEDLRHMLATLQARAFQPLGELDRIWIVPAAQPTGTFSATEYVKSSGTLLGGSYSAETKEITLPEVTLRDLDDEQAYGTRAFRNAGRVRYRLGADYNLVRNPDAQSPLQGPGGGLTDDIAHWPGDAVEKDPSFVDGSPGGQVFSLGEGGTVESDSQVVMDLEPIQLSSGQSPSGVRLTFDGYKQTSKANTPTLQARLEVDGASGTVSTSKSEPDTFAEGVTLTLDGVPDGQVKISFEGNDCAFYQPQVELIEFGQRQQDEIVYGVSDYNGVWDVSDAGAARVGAFAVKRYTNAKYNTSSYRPERANALIKLRRRVVGARGLRTRVLGLYGPETRLVVKGPDLPEGTYMAGVGRRLHIKEGETEIADTQLPDSVL